MEVRLRDDIRQWSISITSTRLVFAAEIMKHYFPKMVDLHNYTAASSSAQKLSNWNTLNRTHSKKKLCTDHGAQVIAYYLHREGFKEAGYAPE
jgi:hypothetical protein